MKVRARVAGLLGAVMLGGSLVGCNAILGIDPASREDDGGGGGGSVTLDYSLNCQNYCNHMQSLCNNSQILSMGDNTEYLSTDVCMKLCAAMPVTNEAINSAADPNPDDTLNCRVWHANAALTSKDPHLHCPHSGPLGGKVCDDNGDPCPTFCRLDLQFCTGENQAYASLQDCLNACEPDAGYAGYTYELNTSDPEVTDLANYEMTNTLNCRMYHLENFIYTQQALHCSHTSLNGNGVCVGVPADL
jgi:hypothetical protein